MRLGDGIGNFFETGRVLVAPIGSAAVEPMICRLSACGERDRRFADSPLEEDGFSQSPSEPSPRLTLLRSRSEGGVNGTFRNCFEVPAKAG